MVTFDWAGCISSLISLSVKKLKHGGSVEAFFKKVVSMVLLLCLSLWGVDTIIWNGYGI